MGVDRIVEVESSKGVTIPLEEVDILLDQLEGERKRMKMRILSWMLLR